MLRTRYLSKYDPLAQPCMSLIGNQYMLTKVGSKSVQRRIKKFGYKVNNPARLQPACAHTGWIQSLCCVILHCRMSNGYLTYLLIKT